MEAMPAWLQPLDPQPIHHFATIVRASMLKAADSRPCGQFPGSARLYARAFLIERVAPEQLS